MKSYDLMIIGPATRDENIDYTGQIDRCIGGAVTFCTPAARAANESVFAAAKKLHAWGVPEILISHNSEMLAYDGKKIYTCPVKSRNLSGRTGRGDTTFGSYLAMRLKGAGIEEALLYATACVSLKMETPGPFRGGSADVEACIRRFY